MDLKQINYPRLLEADPQFAEIKRALEGCAKPLWDDSKFVVPEVKFNSRMAELLLEAEKKELLIRSLEGIERKLEFENRGIKKVDVEKHQTRGERVSRLIILSNDGAQRFYRKIEKLMRHFSPRLMAIRIDMDSVKLGEIVYQKERIVKALLINHKEYVSKILIAATMNDLS